jgi:hypothetical protein
MKNEASAGDLIRLQQALAAGNPGGRMSLSYAPPQQGSVNNELTPIEQQAAVISTNAAS